MEILTQQKENSAKFYQLSVEDRQTFLTSANGFSSDDMARLSGKEGLDVQHANHMIENVVGTYSLPLGIARNFLINGREVSVPMVIEEPSVVAAASFMAKLARPGGGFVTQVSAPEMIGQMQILNVPDLTAARQRLLDQKESLLAEASEIDPVLKKLGGGPRDIEVRLIEESPVGPFLVLHLIYDVRDAMGANAVNTAVERLTPRVEAISGGRVLLRILSNLADKRLASARCTILKSVLAFGNYTAEEVIENILAAWAFAAADPYRAATHNKGIMNGIDPVVIATGNDWRAVEAGAHAYAARSGRYTSLTTWSRDEEGNLCGFIELPMAVGIVGGATRVHPGAQASLKLMGVKQASQLAGIIVSVGLAQNLGALRALATEGIQRGHMSLHARQVAVSAGAEGDEVDKLAAQLIAEKSIRSDRAAEILNEWKTIPESV